MHLKRIEQQVRLMAHALLQTLEFRAIKVVR